MQRAIRRNANSMSRPPNQGGANRTSYTFEAHQYREGVTPGRSVRLHVATAPPDPFTGVREGRL